MRAEGNNQQPFINVLLSFQIAIIHLHTQVLDPRPAATTWFTINLWSQEKIRKYLRMCCQNGSDQTSGWSHSSGPCVGYTQVFKPELIKYWGFLFEETSGGSTVQHYSEWKPRLCTQAAVALIAGALIWRLRFWRMETSLEGPILHLFTQL